MLLKLCRLLGTIIFTIPFLFVILFLRGLLPPSSALTSRPDPVVITSAVFPPEGNLTGTATSAISTITPGPANLGKLAYLQEGDIWVKDLPDGQPRQLTTGGHSREPRWSPSGRWLAYRQGEGDGPLWLIAAAGGQPYQLDPAMRVNDFTWAPANDRLAYVADGNLRLVDLHQGSPVTTTLVTAQSGYHRVGYHLAWHPDEISIAYEWFEQPPNAPLTYQGLWQVDLANGQATELYASGAPEKGTAHLTGWIGNGQALLFWQGELLSASLEADGVPLYLLPASGGAPRLLAELALIYPDFVAVAPLGVSLPDNQRGFNGSLAVVEGSYRGAWMNKRLVVNGEPRTTAEVAVSSPSWSPDGIRLAYTAMPDRGDLVGGEDARLGLLDRRIWLVNASGSPQSQQLTDDSTYRDEYPLWSADGRTLLFARFDRQDRASLWLVGVDGGKPRQVVANLPLLELASDWFGYYGHVNWDIVFDWWRGPAQELPVPSGTPAPSPTSSLTTTLPFTVCQSSPQWTRPTKARQAAQVWTDWRHRDNSRSMLKWTFRQSFYNYGGGGSETILLTDLTACPTPVATAPTPVPTATPTVSSAPVDLKVRVLYAQGGALKSFPGYTVFIRPELQHLYDLLVDEGSLGLYLTAYRPLPSPNGRYLIVNSPAPAGEGETWLADLVTGQLQQVMTPQVAATWSPDSSHITFVAGETLFTAPVTDTQQLTPIFQPGLINLFARWSPTGEWIAVARDAYAEDQTSAERKWVYWLVSPSGKELKYLGTFPVQPFGMIPQDMDWSPDGHWLLTPGQVILNLDGQSRPATDLLADPSNWLPPVLARSALGEAGQAASNWFPSPSGRQIAYLVTNVSLRQNDIYLFDRSTQTHTLISSGVMGDYFASDIRWSPDDRFLVIGTERPGIIRPSGGPIFILKPETNSTPQLLLDGDNLHLVEVLNEIQP